MEPKNQASILIVDDNAYNLEVLSRRLQRRGFLTKCIDNGRAALEMMHGEDFDLVLLDIMMPGMSGMEVLEEARRTFSKTALPIIMVTSKGESEDVVEALSMGANDYVMKPVDFPVALARIQTQLSQRDEISQISKAKPKYSYSLNEGEMFGPYLLKEKVGQGGMGAVYKVHHPVLDRIVALKVILAGHDLTRAQIERFTREARAIAQIKHPNIVGIYEIGEDPSYYFTMDFIEGENLSRLIKEGVITPKTATDICRKVASALQAAHAKGIIHRDLKPSNIMLDGDFEPHLMDFGLAKMESEEEQLTRTGDILGTPEYMAPEQVDPSCGEIDARSDIYSLGVILYEMLTGQAPFSGTPIRVLWQKLNQIPTRPTQINGAILPQLEAICLKAMEKDKDLRYAQAEDMKAALDRLS